MPSISPAETSVERCWALRPLAKILSGVCVSSRSMAGLALAAAALAGPVSAERLSSPSGGIPLPAIGLELGKTGDGEFTAYGQGVFGDTGQSLGNYATTSVALGDVDGDGDLDLVEGNYGQAGRIWLNNGSGRFSDSGRSFGQHATRSVALGDVDGDGDLDLIEGNQGQASKVWLNNGRGVFSDSGQSLGNHATRSVALGDVDGDGDLDLVEGNYGQANRVWLNNGRGIFSNGGQSLGSHATVSVALGDVDGDGDLDLVEGNTGQANRLWLNNGSGVFFDSGQSLGSHNTHGVALGDIDGDGDMDLVVGNYGQANRVWLNNGGGVFQDSGQSLGAHQTSGIFLGDVDADGDLDVVVSTVGQGNRVWLNNGRGVFQDSGQSLGNHKTYSLALGDMDGDGDLDLAMGNYGQPDTVWYNQTPIMPVGSVSLSTPSKDHALNVPADSKVAVAFPDYIGSYSSSSFQVLGSQSGVHAGNFSAGGRTLVFSPNKIFKPGETVTVQLTNRLASTNGSPLSSGRSFQFTIAAGGGGALADGGQSLGSYATTSVALGDVDGDGDLDLVEGVAGQGNRIWLNNGSGSFGDSGQNLGSDQTYGVALGDVDGDGDLDLVTGNFGRPNRVWLNNGRGMFSDSGQRLGNGPTFALALGDVDGDGDLDMVEGVFGQGDRVWLNNGNGVFHDSAQRLGNHATHAVALGDVDGDGDLDLVEGNYGQANRVWLNDGLGVFHASGQSLGADKTQAVILADVDGDGDLDMLEGNHGQANRVWLNNGGGGFTNTGQSLGDHQTYSLTLGDLDGDGDLDMVEGTDGQGERVWLNNGKGIFGDSGQSLGADKTHSVALGDVDGDGDLDLATGNDSQANRVWLSHPLVVNGACGGAASKAVISAPSTNLCAAGGAGTVAGTAELYSWDCSGMNGGTTAHCSVPRAYTVSFSQGAGGSVACEANVLAAAESVAVAYGRTTTCTVTPDNGYEIVGVSGCGGSLSGSAYTTGAITADCAVAASFSPISGTTMPSGGGSTTVSGTGKAVTVEDNGSSGSTVNMEAGSQATIYLPSGSLGVQSSGAAQLILDRVDQGGQATLVLGLVSGSAVFTATLAGQVLVHAGGLTVIPSQAQGSAKATVDARGSVNIQVAQGASLVTDASVPSATTVDLSQGVDVQIRTGGQTISITPVGAGVRIAFNSIVANGVSTPVPAVISGEVQATVAGACVPLLSVNATLVSSAQANTQAEAEMADSLATISIGAGQGLVGPCGAGSGAEAAKTIYLGESAEFDTHGGLQHIRLGSLHRNQAWVGDPLALAGFPPSSVLDTAVTGIGGFSNRIQQNLAVAFLAGVNQGTGQLWKYASAGQSLATGVWSLRAQNTVGAADVLAVWPVGDIVADQGVDALGVSGNGLVQMRSSNLLATFAPALVQPQSFAGEIAKFGADELVFRPDGVLQAVFGGTVYVVQPDWEVGYGSVEGITIDAGGRLTWTDAVGNAQVLYPAFADLDQLLATFRTADPSLVFQYAWRGVVSVVSAGVPMMLIPDNTMFPTPPAHQQEAWWYEGGKVYVRYSGFQYSGYDDFAQGFSLHLP